MPGPLIGGSLLSSGSWRRKERVESAFLGSGDPGRVGAGACRCRRAAGRCHPYLPFRGRLDRTAFRYFL